MADEREQSDVDTLLKVDEVAKLFGVQPYTIREWLKEGRLRGVKIGRGHYWRVPTSAVKALAQELYGEK